FRAPEPIFICAWLPPYAFTTGRARYFGPDDIWATGFGRPFAGGPTAATSAHANVASDIAARGRVNPIVSGSRALFGAKSGKWMNSWVR
ncbi:MAG TPA: hypothetical protein VMV45_19290, partial [Casimicrobiaceae bacterium]|nr:hypothetical protein [Casimicrobiaceae bacterium]